MSESVELGYLISNSEYKSFDEIITVLTNKGKRVAMIAMGVKKITSKNGRNLRFGSLTEFTYFQSRSEDKVSKLKSAHLVEENDWQIQTRHSFNVLCNCVKKTKYTSKEFFSFFKHSLNLIVNDKYNDKVLVSVILFRFLSLNGIIFDDNFENIKEPQRSIIEKNLINIDNAKYSLIKDEINATNKVLSDHIFKILGIKVL